MTEVARHPRSVRKGSQSLLLDHYLEGLARKPGALHGATALAQAARRWHVHQRARRVLGGGPCKAHGDAGGTRALVELLLHCHLAHSDVVAGLTAAVAVGSTSPDVVAVEARKATQLRGATPTFGSADSAVQQAPSVVPARRDRVASLTERRLVEARDRAAGTRQALLADGRPLPSVAPYDELLAHPPATGTQGT